VDGKQSCWRLPAAAKQLKEGFRRRIEAILEGYA
jgi:hypothetical protein